MKMKVFCLEALFIADELLDGKGVLKEVLLDVTKRSMKRLWTTSSRWWYEIGFRFVNKGSTNKFEFLK